MVIHTRGGLFTCYRNDVFRILLACGRQDGIERDYEKRCRKSGQYGATGIGGSALQDDLRGE